MNFIQTILDNGFVETVQKELLELMPHKEKWIPRWWEEYDYNTGWLGLSINHPDAVFKKGNKEVILSLQGIGTGYPAKDEDLMLINYNVARYISLKVNGAVYYETYSGKLPNKEVIERFLNA